MDKREFQDNLADVTAAPALMAGALNGLSNDIAAAVQSSGARSGVEAQFALDDALARQVVITNTERLMGVLSGNAAGISGLTTQFSRDQRLRSDKERKAKSESNNLTLSMLLLNDLHKYEAGLAKTYGDDFAENLFADLHTQGTISDEDYQEAMSVEDGETRKRLIAARIQEGLDDGSIKPADLKGHPWAQEWLEKNEAYDTARVAEAQAALDGRLSADEISRDANFVARDTVIQNAPDIQSAFESAAIGAEQSEQELDDTQEIAVNLTSDLSSMNF